MLHPFNIEDTLFKRPKFLLYVSILYKSIFIPSPAPSLFYIRPKFSHTRPHANSDGDDDRARTAAMTTTMAITMMTMATTTMTMRMYIFYYAVIHQPRSFEWADPAVDAS